MRKILSSTLIALSLVVTSLGLLPAQTVHGIDVFKNGSCSQPSGSSGTEICGAAQQDKFQNILKNVINTMLVVIGIIAVIMIVIGGIKYVVSNGESQQIQSAKNTILYSVIGLILAMAAFPIVNFVIDRFK